MVVITVQGYTNGGVHTIAVGNRELYWVNIIDVQIGLGINNISDLVRKEIYSIFGTKNPAKKQIGKYKRSQKEISK